MSLINYVEPISVGEIFIGLGGLIFLCVMSYVLFRIYIKICHWLDSVVNKEIRYEILEEHFINEIGKEKGVDVVDEMRKRQILQKPSKNFRKRIEDEVFNKMFGDEKDK